MLGCPEEEQVWLQCWGPRSFEEGWPANGKAFFGGAVSQTTGGLLTTHSLRPICVNLLENQLYWHHTHETLYWELRDGYSAPFGRWFDS